MPEAERPPAVVSRMHRRVEQVGLLLLLAAFAFFLWRGHRLIAWSDPAAWYHFGRHFAERFGQARLAYGFPLLVHGAVALVGPVFAFLVNLPLLVLLAALLYATARSLVPRESPGEARLGMLAGAVAVGGLVWLAPKVLLSLVNPYRDPLSYVFVLLSCLLLLRYQSGPERSLGWVAGAGASLALATSTRETSALMLAPFLLFGLAVRRGLPLLRAALVFGASFAVSCIPMLVHNHGASGHFLVPAQAAGVFSEKGSLVPGVGPAHLARTFPRTLHYLWTHQGWPTLLLAGVGVAAGVWRRRPAVFALALPACLAYLLFYGSYKYLVPRYLLVVDLFVLALAGVGAAALVAVALRGLGAGRLAHAAATAAGAAAAAGAVALALAAARSPERDFRIDDALALRNHIAALVPDDAAILGERPMAELLRSFVDHSERVLVLRPRQVFADPAVGERIRQLVGDAPEAYFVSQQEPLTRFMEREFDLELLASFPPASYDLVEDGEARFHVDRVRPWSQRETLARLPPAAAGPYLLRVDVGHLSALERDAARLYWNDELLDDRPRDGTSYYAVEIRDPAAEPRVWLRSDQPVPGRIAVELIPPGRPIRLNFDAEDSIDDRRRLAGGFQVDPGQRYPLLRDQGILDIPTLDRDGAAFVAVAEVGLRRGLEAARHVIAIGSSDVPFYRLDLRGRQDAANPWHRISFALYGPLVTAPETRLVWDYQGPETDGERPPLRLRSLDLYRIELAPELTVDLGKRDEPFLLDGFGPAEVLQGSNPLSFRATASRAELRLPLALDPRPARLEVRYLAVLRPDSAPPPDPELRWNGIPLQGSSQQEAAGVLKLDRVTARFDLPQALLRPVMNQLVIRSTPWQGRGILLERVSVSRVAPEAER